MSVTVLAQATTNNVTSYATASVTPTANALYLLAVATNKNSTPPTVDSISGFGLTWVNIANVLYDDVGVRRGRLTLWRALGSSPTAGAVTATASASCDSLGLQLVEVTNVDTSGTNGSGAVVQVVTNSATDAGATDTPNVTLAAITKAANPTVGFFCLNANGSPADPDNGFTPNAGLTEIGEWGRLTNAGIGIGTRHIVAATVKKDLGTTALGGTMYVANAWGAVGVEVNQSGSSAGVGALTSRTSDVRWLTGNDRYQVVALARQGTTTTSSEFRYWYAGAPSWEHSLASDTAYPSFHTLDENSEYVPGSIETAFKTVKTGQEDQIDGVFVEFYARPTALTEATVTSTYPIGFTCRVEGMGTPNWERTVTSTTTYATTSGIVVSSNQTYSSVAGSHDSESWPNLRSVYFPIRLTGKVRAVRVILTDIHLVAIRRIQLMGKAMPNRNP